MYGAVCGIWCCAWCAVASCGVFVWLCVVGVTDKNSISETAYQIKTLQHVFRTKLPRLGELIKHLMFYLLLSECQVRPERQQYNQLSLHFHFAWC